MTGKPVGMHQPTAQWLKEFVCGQTDDLLRAFAMPNSKVTFDLFWLSRDAVQAFRNWTLISDCQNPKAPPIPFP